MTAVSSSRDALISQIYRTTEIKELRNLLKSSSFATIRESLEIITDHKKPLKYFKFGDSSVLSKIKRTDIRRVNKIGKLDTKFLLIEIDNWDDLAVDDFKKKFQHSKGILVLLSKSLDNPVQISNYDEIEDENDDAENEEFDSNHNFSHLIEGLELKVIVPSNVQEFVLSGTIDTTNLSFPGLKEVKLEHVAFSQEVGSLDMPKLKNVILTESSQEVLESLNLEKLTSLDVTIEDSKSPFDEDSDPVGDKIYKLENYNLENLIWGNFRNFNELTNIQLPKTENMLLLTVPSLNGDGSIISNVDAPNLNELTIEFWKGFPKIEKLNVPNLKSIKLTNIIGNQDEDEEAFKGTDSSSLDSFAHVKHWELYNAVPILSKTSIPEKIEILNITTFKDEEDRHLSDLKLPSLKTLSINRSNSNGLLPKITASKVTSLSITFQEEFKSLHNLNAANYPNLKRLEINNLTSDVIDDIEETVFQNLETLEINGPLFESYDLSKLKKWTFPKLKIFKYEVNSRYLESTFDSSNIKLIFNAPQIEEIKVTIIDTSSDDDNNAESTNLEIHEFPSLKLLEIEGITGLKLSKTNNLRTLISAPDSPLNSIVAGNLSKLELLEYEHSEDLNFSKIEQIKQLNNKVRRKVASLGNFMIEEGDLDMDDDEFETFGGETFNDGDIEEEY